VKVLLGIEEKNEGDNDDNYDFEKYGLGSIRSLSEYEEFSGLFDSFANLYDGFDLIKIFLSSSFKLQNLIFRSEFQR
jgi:hypothetical protein